MSSLSSAHAMLRRAPPPHLVFLDCFLHGNTNYRRFAAQSLPPGWQYTVVALPEYEAAPGRAPPGVLLDILDQAGLERVVLVAGATAAASACSFAASAPARVAGLVLESPLMAPDSSALLTAWADTLGRAGAGALFDLVYPATRSARELDIGGAAGRLGQKIDFVRRTACQPLYERLRAIAAAPALDDGALAAPTLIVCGAGAEPQLAAGRRSAAVTVAAIAGAGPVPHRTMPQACADALTGFAADLAWRAPAPVPDAAGAPALFQAFGSATHGDIEAGVVALLRMHVATCGPLRREASLGLPLDLDMDAAGWVGFLVSLEDAFDFCLPDDVDLAHVATVAAIAAMIAGAVPVRASVP